MKAKYPLLFLFICIIICSQPAFAQQAHNNKTVPFLLGINVKDGEKAAGWYMANLDFTLVKKMKFPEYDSLAIYFLEKDGFQLELI